MIARAALSKGTALRALALLGAGVVGAATIAAPAAAQDFTTGVLNGTVVDAQGARAGGGTATVRSNAQGFTRTATVGADGTFRITALPVGTYTVTIASPNAPAISSPGIGINAGQNNTYTFTVGAPAAAGDAAAGAEGDEIVVVGRAERGNDFGTNTGGINFGDVTNTLNTLPIGRDTTSLILLAPGTTTGDTAFGNLASIGGATVAENVYYVNGLNITNFRNFVGATEPPIEFIQALDVKTFGLSAEFGRALGGFTSAVVKSGSNTFKAGALVSYSPNGLRKDAPNTYAAFNQNDQVDNIESNFYVSGPIIKDRLFFYGLYNPNYSRSINDSTLLGGGQHIVQTNNSPFFGGKIDAILFDGHRIEGTFFRNKQKVRTEYYAFDETTNLTGAQQGQTIDEFGGNQFVVSYNGQFAKWLSLSASYGENHSDQSFTPSPNQSLVQSTLNGVTQTSRGFTATSSTDEDTRKFFRADGDIYVSLLGNHHIRGGYEREKLLSVTDTRRSGDGYNYTLSPNFITRQYYLNQGSFESRNEAFYLQDSWSLFNNRINLNLGVRNDRFNSDTISGDTYFKSGNQWAPRVGASFDVFGDNRTQLQANFARYFLPVATNTNIRLGGAELFYSQRFNYAAGVNRGVVDGQGVPQGLVFNTDGTPQLGLLQASGAGNNVACPTVGPNAGQPCRAVTSDGLAGPTDTLVSSNLQPSYTDEYVLRGEQRISDWTFGLSYIRRRLGRTLDDVAIDQAVNSYCQENGIAGCADVWTGFHQYVLANPGSDITVRLDGDCGTNGRQCDVVTLSAADLRYPKAVRKYDTVQFDFQKAYSNGFGVGGSYSYTKLRGNYEGAVKSDNGQDDAGLTQDFDQPELLDGAYGDLANGRTHQFKLFGSAGIVDGLRVGGNVLFESPRKFSCIGYYYDGNNPTAFGYQNASFYCAQPQFADRPSFANTNGGGPTTSYLVQRGTAFKSQWRKNINLNMQYDLPMLPGSYVSVDAFNILNFKSKVDYNEFGDNSDATLNQFYGQPIGYQAPRSFRFTFAVRFGEQARDGAR